MKEKLIKCLVVLFVLSLVAGMGFAFGDSLQRPHPARSTSELVPLSLARDVAWVRAREVFGNSDDFVPGPVIECADAFGEFSTRIFVFKKGGSIPNDGQILETIRMGAKYEEVIRSGQIPKELASQVDESEILARLRKMLPEIRRPDGTISGYYHKLKMEAVQRNVARLRYGVDDYVSVYVSATWDNTPVPYITKSLPPYFHDYDQIRSESTKHFGGPGAKLSNYYFLGMDGEFFEFTKNGRKMYYNCQLQKTCSPAEMAITLKKLARPASPAIRNGSGLKERFNREWQVEIDEVNSVRSTGR